MNEHFHLSGLVFEVRRSQRRKTLGLTVDRSGELVVHAPDGIGQDELEGWTRKKLIWVHRKLAVKEELRPKNHRPEYVSGEMFFYLGRGYRLVLVDQQDFPLVFDGRGFTLRRDARSTAEEAFRTWYIATGAQWVAQRVGLLAKDSHLAVTN